MSAPKLVLTGDVNGRYITNIGLDYGTFDPNRTTGLIRGKYMVKREYINKILSQNTPKRHLDIPYDRCRLVHTFVGYTDVLTQSVVDGPDADDQTAFNIGLINNALFYDNSADEGIAFDYRSFPNSALGPDKPTSNDKGEMKVGVEYNDGSLYKRAKRWSYIDPVDGQTIKEANFWVIKDISIQDNQNNTTRVVFTFEIKQKYLDIAIFADDIIGG